MTINGSPSSLLSAQTRALALRNATGAELEERLAACQEVLQRAATDRQRAAINEQIAELQELLTQRRAATDRRREEHDAETAIREEVRKLTEQREADDIDAHSTPFDRFVDALKKRFGPRKPRPRMIKRALLLNPKENPARYGFKERPDLQIYANTKLNEAIATAWPEG
jgi:hypothetical protein